jgi:hypothetical protein
MVDEFKGPWGRIPYSSLQCDCREVIFTLEDEFTGLIVDILSLFLPMIIQ